MSYLDLFSSLFYSSVYGSINFSFLFYGELSHVGGSLDNRIRWERYEILFEYVLL